MVLVCGPRWGPGYHRALRAAVSEITVEAHQTAKASVIANISRQEIRQLMPRRRTNSGGTPPAGRERLIEDHSEADF